MTTGADLPLPLYEYSLNSLAFNTFHMEYATLKLIRCFRDSICLFDNFFNSHLEYL